MERRIDLHTHSTVSDGTESPANLVIQAQEAGLSAVAITDHDSTAGWDEALETAKTIGMSLVPGLELSTKNYDFSVHIVSYLVDPSYPELVEELDRLQHSRNNRAEQIVANLGRDFDISWEEVNSQVPSGSTVGRPHIADALVAKGIAADRYQAFEEILHPRHGYTVTYPALQVTEGIELIRRAGGVPVLAHPGTSTRGQTIPKSELTKLVDAGLFALEIEHPENREELKPVLYELAKYFNLEVTGSSDWHGTGKINRLGDGVTKVETFEKLLGEASGTKPYLNW